MEIIATADTPKKMYRYLFKYVGTYRVKAEYDQITKDFPRAEDGSIDNSFEDLYIPCAKGAVVKHTYIGDDILACYFYNKIKTALNTWECINKQYPGLDIEFEDDTPDGVIYFHAKDFKKLATIIKPQTSGKGINPFSKKNLPKSDYTIPNKDLNRLTKLTQNLSRAESLQFFRRVNSDFLTDISTSKKNYQYKFKSCNMTAREYIHSIGFWDKYIEYVAQQLPIKK